MYAVHSVYWESFDWRIWWDNEQGAKNRFKLRMRWYDDDPFGPVFFEIKRPTNVQMNLTQAAMLDLGWAYPSLAVHNEEERGARPEDHLVVKRRVRVGLPVIRKPFFYKLLKIF